MKRTYTPAQIREMDLNEVDRGDWRWGSNVRYVFEDDGRHWMTPWIQVHVEDGMQLFSDVECVEVHQVEKVVKVREWEPVP